MPFGASSQALVGAPMKLVPGIDPGSSNKFQSDQGEAKYLPKEKFGQLSNPEGFMDPRSGVEKHSSEVIMGRLDSIDPSSVGLLSAEDGGFGTKMWSGSDRAFVERLIPRLPAQTLSPAMQDLSRRILLSEALVPEGEPFAASLLGLRAERLSASGQTSLVRNLLSIAPKLPEDLILAKTEVNMMLLSGNHSGACKNVEVLLAKSNDPFWLKVLAFCKALEGQSAAAQLAVSLLREQGDIGDDIFFNLVKKLIGQSSPPLTSLIDPSPLHLAMLRVARLKIPSDSVPGAQPAILRSIAMSPNASIETRLVAAERAEAAGALSPESLATIYESVELSKEDYSNWEARFVKESGPKINALLYQVASKESDTEARAQILISALVRSRISGGFNSTARVMHRICKSITPMAQMAWAAPDITRALLAANDVSGARLWFDVIFQGASAKEDNSAMAMLEIWPLVQLMDHERTLGWNSDALIGWWQVEKGRANKDAYGRATLLFTLMDAIGYEVPDVLWQELMGASLTVTGYLPSVQLWKSLERASQGGRVGETVLLSLLALGDVGPSGTNPVVLHSLITSLRSVGLGSDARRLALEAALAIGL